eukprot:364253-Chlamydomonas_euryale.AAC.22
MPKLTTGRCVDRPRMWPRAGTHRTMHATAIFCASTEPSLATVLPYRITLRKKLQCFVAMPHRIWFSPLESDGQP